jgi:F-type H+-transporting ATPase subunit c
MEGGEAGNTKEGMRMLQKPINNEVIKEEVAMKKVLSTVMGGMLLVLVLAPLAIAAEQAAAASGATVDYTKAIVIGCSLIAVGIAMGLGTIGTGVGMGHGLSGATNAVGRNPEAQGKILLTMMVGLAMIESLAIYALVIALVVLYANPLLKFIGG